MRTIIVGGDTDTGRESSIVKQLHDIVPWSHIHNGELPKQINGFDLTIWMPNISNEEPKDYPKKDKGSVLICSKVMRNGYTHIDSVSRIFKMHGHAVIEIYKEGD